MYIRSSCTLAYWRAKGNPGIFGAGAGEPEGAFESAASLAMSLTSVVMSDEILSASDLYTSRLVQVLKGGKERRT